VCLTGEDPRVQLELRVSAALDRLGQPAQSLQVLEELTALKNFGSLCLSRAATTVIIIEAGQGGSTRRTC
jgi:hypothetical protein